MNDDGDILLRLEPSPERGDAIRLSDLGRYMEGVAEAFTELAARHNPKLSEILDWELTRAATNSPLAMTVQPIASMPDVVLPKKPEIINYVRRELEIFFSSLDGHGGISMGQRVRDLYPAIEKLLKPLAGGAFGRMRIETRDGEGVSRILDVDQGAAVEWMARIGDLKGKDSLNFKWREIGSIICRMVEVRPYFGKPAFRATDEITGAEVICKIPDDLTDKIGHDFTLDAVWEEARIMVSGTIIRKRGRPYIISVKEVERLDEDGDPEMLITAIRRVSDEDDGDLNESWGQRLWGAGA